MASVGRSSSAFNLFFRHRASIAMLHAVTNTSSRSSSHSIKYWKLQVSLNGCLLCVSCALSQSVVSWKMALPQKQMCTWKLENRNVRIRFVWGGEITARYSSTWSGASQRRNLFRLPSPARALAVRVLPSVTAAPVDSIKGGPRVAICYIAIHTVEGRGGLISSNHFLLIVEHNWFFVTMPSPSGKAGGIVLRWISWWSSGNF